MKKSIYVFTLSIILLAGSAYGAGSANYVAPPDNTAYDATTWNGSLRAPTKNAVRDYLETVAPGGVVATASALAANGANCSAGQAPLGVDAAGAVEGCFAVQAYNADLQSYTETITAGGTADALTADFTTNITPAAGTRIRVIAASANATTTPTLAVDGTTARTIVKLGGVALVAGDIKGAGHVLELQYDLANTRWELLNPANPGSAAADSVAVSNFPWKNSAGNYVSAIASASTPGLSIVNNKTFTVNNTLTLAGTDSTTMTFPSTSATIARTDAGQTFTGVNAFTSPTFTTRIDAVSNADIGSATTEWGNIYLKDSAVIYFQADQSVSITSAATGLTFNKAVTVSDVTNDNYIQVTNNSGGRAPTASKYEIYPDAGIWKLNQNGTEYSMIYSSLLTNGFDVANSVWGASNSLVFEGATANDFETSLSPDDPTTDNTVTIPDYSGSMPIIIAQGYTQTLLEDTDAVTITGSSITLADGWFTEGKTLKYVVGGTVTGANGTISIILSMEGGAVMTLTTTDGAAGDWIAEFTIVATGAATQRIIGKLIAEGGVETKVDYAAGTVNTATAGTIPVLLQLDLGHADDAISSEYVQIWYWNKAD